MYMLVLPQSHISIKTLHFCEAQCLGSKTWIQKAKLQSDNDSVHKADDPPEAHTN
jgi:hypothetical protein